MAVQHKLAALTKRHAPHNWEYADASARTSAGGFVSADLYKIALQLDDKSYWMLTATTPTWARIIGAPAGSAGGDLSGSYPNPGVAKAKGITLPTPAGADDGKVLAYQHSGTQYVLTTISSGPTGSAGGDLGGTYPNPSVAAVNGVDAPSPSGADDGKYLKYVHGSTSYVLDTPAGGGGAVEGVGFDSLTDPGVVADYAWVNQETATATKDSDGSIVLQTDYSGGDDWRILKKSLGSTPWTIIGAFTFYLHGRNYCSCGIVLRESSSGKLINFGPGYDDSIGWCARAIKWTDPNTFSADIIGNQMRIPPGQNMIWIKVTNDATDIKGYISPDGKYWVQYCQIGATAFMTPNEYGIGLDVNNVYGGVLKLFRLTLT